MSYETQSSGLAKYTLQNIGLRNAMWPHVFTEPVDNELKTLKVGDIVTLKFDNEKLPVKITSLEKLGKLTGRVLTPSTTILNLGEGHEVVFVRDNILSISERTL